MREVKVGLSAIGHFPVFEDDGVTKHTGLTGVDFAVTVYQDSVPVVVAVTITEIGSSGEYQYSFTPASAGVYDLQILCLFNNDLVGDSLLAVVDTSQALLVDVKAQADKIDLAATIGPGSAAIGSLMDQLCNKDGTQTYDQATDSLQGIRDRIG